MGNSQTDLKVAHFAPYVFDSSSKQWAEASDSSKPPAKVSRKLKIATLNVWFGEFCQEERREHQIQLFRTLDLDIVCLQEVTPSYAYGLLKSQWIRENYWLSLGHKQDRMIVPYGVMILGKLNILPLSLGLVQLPSEMGRDLLVAKIGSLTVATVHLESLNSAPQRKIQLEKISLAMTNEANVFLMGDFNFDELRLYQDIETVRKMRRKDPKSNVVVQNLEPRDPSTCENKVLTEVLPKYKDLWKEFHPGELGYTFDSVANTMLHNYEQMRYDRMMAKFTEWKAESIDLFANDALDPHMTGGEVVFPSDHFGLVSIVSPL